MNVSDHNSFLGHECTWASSCMGTIVYGNNRVWAQSFLDTIMYWHNRVWAQSCGHSRMGTTCIIATYPTKLTSLFWFEMPVYYVFYIFQFQDFFQTNKKYKPEKRTVRRHILGNTLNSFPIFFFTNKQAHV